VRPIVLSAPGSTGPSAPAILDIYLTPFQITLAVEFGTASATSKVQYSCDDPYATYATNYNTDAVWFDHPTLVNLTANGVDTITTPVRAVRLDNTAWTSGVVTLTVIQAGVMG
jgi:hypothetical protein